MQYMKTSSDEIEILYLSLSLSVGGNYREKLYNNK